MARRSRKTRGKTSPVVTDELEPKSSSTCTSKRQRRKSAGEPQGGSRMETRSSTTTKAKVNETDKVEAIAKCNDNNRTVDEVLEPPTKKLKNSSALGSPPSPSTSASSSGGQNSTKASTSKTSSSSSSSSSSKSPDKTTEINNTSELHKNLFPFPIEIYEMIFKELKGPHLQDLHNVSNATPQWRKLLKKDRVLFLFPKVFEILVREGFTDFYPTKNEVQEYLEDEEDFDFDLYNLRLVCKSWNESILNYIQLHPAHWHLAPFDKSMYAGMPDDAELGFYHIKRAYQFEGTEGITEFMDKHLSTHSSKDNPFFSRLVHIRLRERVGEADQEEFWNTVVNLLQTYGKHIYHFRVTFDDPMTIHKFFQLLNRVISLLPNIKTLHINYNQHKYRNFRRTTEREKNNMVRDIASGEVQLPKLANLQVLEMDNLPDVISHHLLQRNDHVKKLKVQISRGLPIKLSRIFQEVAMIRELDTLHINLQTRKDIEDLETTLGSTPAWPVKSLVIPFSATEDGDARGRFFPVNQWPQWNRIFRLIEDKFGETLVNLQIHLPKTEFDEDQKLLRDATASTFRLNLPHLKQLTVEIPNLTSVDFLLGVKDTLEELTIKVAYWDKFSVAERRREQIKFNGIFKKMERSNIWDMLPKLDKLVVHVYKNDAEPIIWLRKVDIYSYARYKVNGVMKSVVYGLLRDVC